MSTLSLWGTSIDSVDATVEGVGGSSAPDGVCGDEGPGKASLEGLDGADLCGVEMAGSILSTSLGESSWRLHGLSASTA